MYSLPVFVALAVAAIALAAVFYAVGDRVYAVLGSVAFGLHVLAGVAVLRWLPYRWDIDSYHRAALALLAGQPTGESDKVVAFARVVAWLYEAFGADLLVVTVFNAFLAVVLVLPLAAMARWLYDDCEAGNGVRTAALFAPSVLFFTSLPMRDTLSFALFVVALAAITAVFRGKPFLVLVAVPGLLWLERLRIELAGLVLAGTALALIVAAVERRLDRQVSVPSLILGVGVTGLLGLIPFSRWLSIQRLNHELGIRSVGGAVYLDGFQYGSWLDVVVAGPVRGLYFQFAPFPLHVNSVFDFLAALTLPLLVVALVATVRSLHDLEWSTPVGALVGMVYLGGVVGYGVVDSNFGTTVRHRVPFVLLLLVFAAPVIERWWDRLAREVAGRWARLRGGVDVAPGQDGGQAGDEAEAPEGGGLGGP